MLSNFNVITLFPEIFQNWINVGVLSHGIEEKLFEFQSPLKVVGALTVLITFVAGIFPGIFSYLGEVSSIFFGN